MGLLSDGNQAMRWISAVETGKSTNAPAGEEPRVNGGGPGASRLLQNRLKLVEDLWQTVLRSECPPEQSERLLRLKQLCDPVALEGRDGDSSSEAIKGWTNWY